MRKSISKSAVGLSLFLLLAPAFQPVLRADEGPTERTVVTQDGAMYRGEVAEYVIGDHITLKLDTGEVKRIVWADAVQISPPRIKQKRAEDNAGKSPSSGSSSGSSSSGSSSSGSSSSGSSSSGGGGSAPAKVQPIISSNPVPTPVAPGTERTVVGKDGLTYHGEVLEFEAGSHILLQLATGEKRRIGWNDAKRISPPRTRGSEGSEGAYSPERTFILPDGSSVRGELVESQVGEYTMVKLGNGQFRRFEWNKVKRILVPLPTGRPSQIPTSGELLVHVDNGSRVQGEYFQLVPDDELVLRHASGKFRIIPVGTIKKIVVLGNSAEQ
jgi:hypothetical protein